MMHDNNGSPFLLLRSRAGFAVAAASTRYSAPAGLLRVTETVGLYVTPVPHTRTAPACTTGGSPTKVGLPTEGTMRFPASFDAYLDYVLQEEHFHTNGFTTQVPNCLTQSHSFAGGHAALARPPYFLPARHPHRKREGFRHIISGSERADCGTRRLWRSFTKWRELCLLQRGV